MYNFRKSTQFRSCQVLCKRYAHKNYYIALGLTPNATQADIKKAYYDLSMKHHPDKKQGSQERFLEISTAYEVLGNVKLRGLYDRGLVAPGQRPPDPRDVPDPPPPSEFDSRYYRSRSMPSAGRTRVYNFDEWQQQHYTNLRQQGERVRQRQYDHRKQQYEEMHRVAEGGANVTGILFFMFLFAVAYSSMGPDYDRPRYNNQYDKSRKDR